MLFISEANSVHFVKVNSNLPNRENTLVKDQRRAAHTMKYYKQTFKNTQTLTLQLGADDSTVPTVHILEQGIVGTIVPTLKTTYDGNVDPADDRWYFEFDLDLSLVAYQNKTLQIKVTQGADVWISEDFVNRDITDDLANGYLVGLGYTNSSKPSDYFNFQMDYTTGIQFFFYVEAVLTDSKLIGSKKVVKNINRKEMTESQLFIQYSLKTKQIPEYLAVLIGIAADHSEFYINQLEYVSEKVPDIDQVDRTNVQILIVKVTLKNAVAFNTDIRGIVGGDMVPFKFWENLALVSTDQFTLEKEYLLHAMWALHNVTSVSSYSFKVGLTPGGDELMSAQMTNVPIGGGRKPLIFDFHDPISFDSDTEIYVELSAHVGAVAEMKAQLLLNE